MPVCRECYLQKTDEQVKEVSEETYGSETRSPEEDEKVLIGSTQ